MDIGEDGEKQHVAGEERTRGGMDKKKMREEGRTKELKGEHYREIEKTVCMLG